MRGLLAAAILASALAGPVSAEARTAYVVNQFVNTVTPLDLVTNTAGAPIPVGNQPVAVAITPNGATAYVTNFTSSTVTPIATGTNTPGAPIPVAGGPVGIAITPDGATAYVANRSAGSVTPLPLPPTPRARRSPSA